MDIQLKPLCTRWLQRCFFQALVNSKPVLGLNSCLHLGEEIIKCASVKKEAGMNSKSEGTRKLQIFAAQSSPPYVSL
eukprot:UN00544